MWITRFEIHNYSSFKNSGPIELDRSFNLFVGANNSGKSALLKSLCFPLADNSHKNPSLFRGIDLPKLVVQIDVRTTTLELQEKFSLIGEIPNFPAGDGNRASSETLDALLRNPESIIDLEFTRQPSADTIPRLGASIANLRHQQGQVVFAVALTNAGPSVQGRAGNPDTLWRAFSGQESESYFFFDAQRLNIGRSAWNSPKRLQSNASNLATVLAYLQGSRRPIFDLIESHVIDILGGIERITLTPHQSEYEILLWPDRKAAYEELAFGLNESGTGVGQLLAIVTAMVTSEQSVIIIDEINSFLHPSAVKRLLALMRSTYGQHQYIVSTHSSDVIGTSNAERIYLVKRNQFQSSVEKISLSDAKHAREISSILGFSMMDVFGHERMVWVEGPTEEICFPLIVSKYDLIKGQSLGFAPVFSTAGFSEGRGASRAATQVYELAGKQLSPLLKGMAFALDREKLSDNEVTKLEKSRKKLRFLPRRCLECYLLEPQAIAYVLSSLDEKNHTVEEVESVLGHGGDNLFDAPGQWNGEISHSPWLKRVDAPRLLNHVFTTLTENRVEFRKTRDTPVLLKKVMDDEPDKLADLVAFVKKVVEIAMRDTPP